MFASRDQQNVVAVLEEPASHNASHCTGSEHDKTHTQSLPHQVLVTRDLARTISSVCLGGCK